jgi:hypothetical protein
MVREILGLGLPLPADAADALAVAICHAHQRRLNARLVAIGSQGKTPVHANPAAAALLGLRGRRGGRRR